MAKEKVTQDEPTAPRAVDEAGYELDEYNLPRSGPARQRALAGRADPALHDAAMTPALVEELNNG